jgi:hypothetical protein
MLERLQGFRAAIVAGPLGVVIAKSARSAKLLVTTSFLIMIARAAYNAIDFWSNYEFLHEKFPWIAEAISAGWSDLVTTARSWVTLNTLQFSLLVVGLIWMALSARRGPQNTETVDNYEKWKSGGAGQFRRRLIGEVAAQTRAALGSPDIAKPSSPLPIARSQVSPKVIAVASLQRQLRHGELARQSGDARVIREWATSVKNMIVTAFGETEGEFFWSTHTSSVQTDPWRWATDRIGKLLNIIGRAEFLTVRATFMPEDHQ